MGATNERDQLRIDLENIIALLTDTDDHLRVAQMLLAQWARTDYEVNIFNETAAARRDAHKALKMLAAIHPNGRERKEKGE